MIGLVLGGVLGKGDLCLHFCVMGMVEGWNSARV